MIALLPICSFSPSVGRSLGALSLCAQEWGGRSIRRSRQRLLDGVNVPVREDVADVHATTVSPWVSAWNALNVKIMLRECEATRRRECYRAKNRHASATRQLVHQTREDVFGMCCFVCDRSWFMRDTARRNNTGIFSQSRRNGRFVYAPLHNRHC